MCVLGGVGGTGCCLVAAVASANRSKFVRVWGVGEGVVLVGSALVT